MMPQYKIHVSRSGAPWSSGALGPGPPGPLDKRALLSDVVSESLYLSSSLAEHSGPVLVTLDIVGCCPTSSVEIVLISSVAMAGAGVGSWDSRRSQEFFLCGWVVGGVVDEIEDGLGNKPAWKSICQLQIVCIYLGSGGFAPDPLCPP